jgi:GMP synthase PP-ATPase subunit
MPVKQKVNKSAEIRKLHASGVTSATEIVAKLKAQGIRVTPTLVYNVIASKRGKRSVKEKAASQSSRNETVIDTAVLFVRQSGGMTKARELLAKLSLLHD